jgi:hypothetical protein
MTCKLTSFLLAFKGTFGGFVSVKNVIIVSVDLDHLATLTPLVAGLQTVADRQLVESEVSFQTRGR